MTDISLFINKGKITTENLFFLIMIEKMRLFTQEYTHHHSSTYQEDTTCWCKIFELQNYNKNLLPIKFLVFLCFQL